MEKKNKPDTPKMKTGLFQTIRMEESMRFKWVNVVSSAGEEAEERTRRCVGWLSDVLGLMALWGSTYQFVSQRERENEKAEVINENKNNGVASDRRLSPANIRKNCYCQSSVTSQNS